MKYIKAYEKSENDRLDELKKLLSYISTIFHKLGYRHRQNYTEYQYMVHFYKIGRQPYTYEEEEEFTSIPLPFFDISGEFSRLSIFISITERIGSSRDPISKFVPEYFKTISGLKLHSENNSFFNTTFEVVDNVDEIIDKISIEDFELKLNRKKYNL